MIINNYDRFNELYSINNSYFDSHLGQQYTLIALATGKIEYIERLSDSKWTIALVNKERLTIESSEFGFTLSNDKEILLTGMVEYGDDMFEEKSAHAIMQFIDERYI